MRPKLSIGYSQRGADMGRAEIIPDDQAVPIKMYLRPITFPKAADGGCYDEGGAYWGSGTPVYWAHGELPEEMECHTTGSYVLFDAKHNQVDLYFRAASRKAAKAHVLTVLPNATFYQ